MKRKSVLIILASTILGIFLGGMIREYNNKNDSYVDKDSLMKKEQKVTYKNIKSLKKAKEKIEKEYETLKSKHEDKEKLKELENIKEMLSYTDIKGKGIVIELDGLNDDVGNIANYIDYNKILINLVNDLKLNGGNYISINNKRINLYSEIVLAGSHININSTPIAPPYEIKCIGDMENLSYVYLDKGNKYIENIQNNYPLKINIKLDQDMELKKITLPNKLKYIKDE
ncbi:MAG: DUF881 domain-containing protein [Romboutsia sp.]